MIKAIIFDLDGTLVQTEKLKAESYARAAVELSGGSLSENKVFVAFKDFVGLSRQEVSEGLLKRFQLDDTALKLTSEFKVSSPWQVYSHIRLRIYESMLLDKNILLKHVCPFNTGLLKWARDNRFLTGLATMSHFAQANNVLKIVGIEKEFDCIATVDDIKRPKPDPEIYLYVAEQLDTDPDECLVIEDSLSGVKAALNAGMQCIASTTEFTRKAVHESRLIEERWIVDDPSNLITVAQRLVENSK
jgi:beta-phosphoglucomutase-like phosphatase (HAD superfamily)